MAKLQPIGKVIHYWTRLGVAGVELTDTLKMDEPVHFLGATTDFGQRVTSLQLNKRFINEAFAGQQVGILVADRVRTGDTVYRVID
jgi:translation initiation factor IF-2